MEKLRPKNIMKKYSWLYYMLSKMGCLLCGVVLLVLSSAVARAYPERLVQHRVAADGSERLLTPVARYTDAAGRTVDLVGAIHLADAVYYRNLNRAFLRYDKVLYEMVDGEDVPELLRLARKIGDGTATEEEQARFELMVDEQQQDTGSPFNNMLAHYYVLMSQTLRLSLQSECIDYSLESMVFADMSSEEFARAMHRRGESWFTLLLRSSLESGSSSPAPLALALTRSGLRRSIIRALATESSSSSSAWEQSAIIVSRNEKCFAVLDRELATAPHGTRIAIFYGAMHLRDMHYRMLSRGFSLQGVQWITAIRG